jgi:hypothetical protein
MTPISVLIYPDSIIIATQITIVLDTYCNGKEHVSLINLDSFLDLQHNCTRVYDHLIILVQLCDFNMLQFRNIYVTNGYLTDTYCVWSPRWYRFMLR